MKLFLIVAKGKRKGEPIPIEFDLFVVGSAEECQLRAVHESIGAQHCAILMRERKVFVRDLDSGGSTMVNGEEVPPGEEWPLHAGDLLSVGPLEFMVQYNERSMSRRDLEDWAHKCLDLDSSRKLSAMDLLERVSATKQTDDAASTASAILDHMSAMSGVVVGRLRISREAGVTVVRINDAHLVDPAEINLLRKELHDNLNRPNLKVLLDLKSVRKLSSAAAEMLGDLQVWLRPFGSKLGLCRTQPEISAALKAFPVMRTVRFFEDKPQALQANW